ncbi:MAG: potassium/proton antiporter [Pseudomonadota bacterium]
MEVGLIILAVALLSVCGLLAGAAGQKIDAPILLVFLLVGMLAGREGPGGIEIDATQTVIVWASAALAAILFEGGLRTRFSVFKLGAQPGLLLAVGGTVATAMLVAPAARWLFGLDWGAAFLLGAIVSATDAAAVFALASTGLKMPERVAAILEVESGNNDPIAILLVIALSISLAGQPLSPSGWVVMLIQKLSLGALTGLAVGYAAPRILKRAGLWGSLRSILAASLGFVAFGFAETIGGSGFLAIYLAGLTLAAQAPDEADRAAGLLDGVAWLAQTALFLLLGLLITPSHLASVAVPALGLSLVLILLARPIAVVASLAPFSVRLRDMTFISWVGLRGATPVFLGLIPASLGVPNGNLYLSAAAVVVLLSLVIQGWTAPVVGRALNLSGDAEAPVDRGETLARAGAVASAIGVGAWFTIALSPSAGLVLVDPETPVELQSALANDIETPGAFPPGFSDLPIETRRPLFIETLMVVADSANRKVEADLERVQFLKARIARGDRLSLSEDAEIDAIARRYGRPLASIDQLAESIGPVPSRLAVAQAAIATGWGASRGAVESNAVFGLGLSRGYPDLVSAADDLVRLYARHADFGDFRRLRAEAAASGSPPAAEDLADAVGPFAADSDAYVGQLRLVLLSIDR